jgi:arylsulfatase A-like enzyme/alpha-L-fucosidase
MESSLWPPGKRILKAKTMKFSGNLLSVALLLLPAAAAWAAPAEQKHPNVLFIFTDDQRADTIAALGNPEIKTPNLDRLARKSYVFCNAYNFGGNSSAVCIPARNALMTGKTHFRFDDGAYDKGLGATLPKAMKAAGYETYYREKSGQFNLPYIQKQFDHYADIDQVGSLASGYAGRGIVDEAVKFLSGERDKSKPFFMYLGFPCPHDPRWSAKEFRDLYDPAKLPLPPNYQPVHAYNIGVDMTCRDERLEAWPRTPEAIRRHLHDYYSLITGMDRDIGRLLDALDKQALAENTIIIFSSDQGIALGSHGLMGKQNLYDDTQRVPLLISGPGIPQGKSAALGYVHDIFPTICELAMVPVPEGIDGRSLAPVIRGKSEKVRDQLMMAYTNTQRSVRDGRWKLIRLAQINRTQLFDLEKDPRELNDLAADPQHAGQIERLLALLKEEQGRCGDRLPLTSRNPQPERFDPPKQMEPTPYPSGGLAPGGNPVRGKHLPPGAVPVNDPVVGAEEMLKAGQRRFKVVYPLQPESAKRLEWFKEAKFGMFIHWGIYSPRGGIAPDGKPQQHGYTEWYQKANQLSHAEYAKLAGEFNPAKFDADRWVRLAKQAGMRYITFTAKHHDGFCMFDSKFTAYDVVDATPFGRDVVKELRAACDRHGLKLCLYYSHCQDWEQWDAWQTSDWIYPDKKGQPVDHEKYLTGKLLPQVEELCRNYHPDGLWFDTPWFNAQKLDRAVSKRICDTVRQYAPNALINSRLAHGSDSNLLHADLFDYLTLGDQALPDSQLPLYAESPDSVTISYGYDARPGVSYRKAPELARRMIRTVANNGNYLLNVGPSGAGEIPAPAATELERLGKWLEINGEAIYGTTANPLERRQAWGEMTGAKDRLFLFPLRHQGGDLVVGGLKRPVAHVRILGTPADLPFSSADGSLKFAFPADVPGEMPKVIAVELK